jgi:plastocyanin
MGRMPTRRPRQRARPRRHRAILAVGLVLLAASLPCPQSSAEPESYQLAVAAVPEGRAAVRATVTTDIPAPIHVVVDLAAHPGDPANRRIEAVQRIRVANGRASTVLARAPKDLPRGDYLVRAAFYPEWGLPEGVDLPRRIREPLEASAVVTLRGPAKSGADISGSVVVREKGGKKDHKAFDNALVFLSGRKTPPPSTPAVVNQKNKTFLPRVLPVLQGQKVYFTNQDSIDHNVYSTEKTGAFDLGRYPLGVHRTVTFNALGTFKVYCNIHQKMMLDVAVLENPFFDVTSSDGSFRIEGVPPGQYTLRVQHVYGGAHSMPLAVGAEDIALDPIAITSTKVIREITNHKNKHGRRYRKTDDSDEEYY